MQPEYIVAGIIALVILFGSFKILRRTGKYIGIAVILAVLVFGTYVGYPMVEPGLAPLTGFFTNVDSGELDDAVDKTLASLSPKDIVDLVESRTPRADLAALTQKRQSLPLLSRPGLAKEIAERYPDAERLKERLIGEVCK